MRVVIGQVIGDAGSPAMHLASAKRLSIDGLRGRRFHQRRPAQEDRALVLHDDGLVRHCRNIGSARDTGAHHDGDLWDAAGREPSLVVEDPAEVVAVGEHLVLQRQISAA